MHNGFDFVESFQEASRERYSGTPAHSALPPASHRIDARFSSVRRGGEVCESIRTSASPCNCVPVCPWGAIHIATAAESRDGERERVVWSATETRLHRGMSKGHSQSHAGSASREFSEAPPRPLRPEPGMLVPRNALTEYVTWPRIVRCAFSEPTSCWCHESTGVAGRGTEEVKTNDVTDWVRVGEVGSPSEFGRPGVGVRFRDIQKMSMALVLSPVKFGGGEYQLFGHGGDPRGRPGREGSLGHPRARGRPEHATPAPPGRGKVAGELSTIVAIGVATRCDAQGENLLEPLLQREGYAGIAPRPIWGWARPAAPTV